MERDVCFESARASGWRLLLVMGTLVMAVFSLVWIVHKTQTILFLLIRPNRPMKTSGVFVLVILKISHSQVCP